MVGKREGTLGAGNERRVHLFAAIGHGVQNRLAQSSRVENKAQ